MVGDPFLTTYLILIIYFYFSWFWIHGGQTPGMRAWRVRVCANAGRFTWRNATLRFLSAALSWLCLGLGFFWAWLDRDGRCWHDHLSRSHLEWAREGILTTTEN
jgi:uncharacterized RDD family membrane protein YckC